MTMLLETPTRAHLTIEECWTRYPRLTRAVQWIIIGSTGEAGSCIRDYRDGLDFSCEAVSHSGLTPRDRIEHAFRVRQSVRQSLGGRLAPAA